MVRSAVAFLLLWALSASGRAQAAHAQFMDEFQKSQQFKDDKLLDRSLQTHSRVVVEFYCGLAREWRNAGPEASDRARAQMDLLLASWKRVYKSETLDKVERYYASADGKVLKQLDVNQTAFEVTQRNLANAREGKRRLDLEAAKDTLWKLADTYEKLGHNVKASEAWENVAVALTSMPDITLLERRDAVFSLERYKSLREAWQFTEEPTYKQNISWLKATKADLDASEATAKNREAKGVQGEATGPDAVVDPKAPEIVADLRFEVMKAEIEDCFVQGGVVMPNWQIVRLTDDKPAQVVFFQNSALYAAHIGGKYYIGPSEVDLANKGTLLTVGAKPKPTQFWLDDKKTKPYAMWCFVGTDKEPFMGLEQNLLPTDKLALLYYKSAASYHGTVNGEEVVLYDNNGDGRWMNPDPNAPGIQMAEVEVGKLTAVPAYDCMQIGKKGLIQPFSGYAKLGDKWFHLRPAKEGAAISARSVIPEFFKTGTLQMKWTGPRTTTVQCMVVRGEGDLAITAFNLVSGKPIEVPAGTYKIDFGRIAEGKGGIWSTADILAGNSELIVVKPGEAKVISIGAPFVFEFEKATSGADIEVNSHKLTLLGVAKERYVRLNSCVPEIEVLLARDDKGRGAKAVGSFGPVPDHDVSGKLNAEFPDIGYFAPMFPVVKGAKERFNLLRFQPTGTGFVALRAAKAKVFGKIESAWK